MTFLRTAFALTIVVLATVVVMGTGILVSFFTGGTAPAIHRFYTAFGRCALFGLRSRVRVSGLDHLSAGQRYVIVPNHQSNLDVPALLIALRDHPVRFVAKEELRRIPIFGAALRRSGTIFVTRSNAKEDTSRMDEMQAKILNDVSVLFFAEGTRSKDGQLGPFKKGAAAFAIKSGLPLVPIGVAGSRAIVPHGLRVQRGGTIAVSIGAPIQTGGRSFDDRGVLTDEIRSAVEKELERATQLAAG